MISDLRVVSPREGKVQYPLAHAGDTIAAGAPIVTLIDLTDVYMTVFVRAADAAKLGLSDQARLILDAAPDSVIPATVGFVASGPPPSSKASGAKDQLAKEMLRVDLMVDPKVLQTYYAKVETGLRGVGFVRTRADAKWPPNLQIKLPPAPIAQQSPPAPAHVAQEPASPSAPIGGPADLSKGASVFEQTERLSDLRAALRRVTVAASAVRASICPYRGLEPFSGRGRGVLLRPRRGHPRAGRPRGGAHVRRRCRPFWQRQVDAGVRRSPSRAAQAGPDDNVGRGHAAPRQEASACPRRNLWDDAG
jgi:hypothetical protein